jgi:hypothetical protein
MIDNCRLNFWSWKWVACYTIALFIIPKLIQIWRNRNARDPWDSSKLHHWFVELYFSSVLGFAKLWHNYRIFGLENLSKHNCLLVGYHSRPTIDVIYAMAAIRPASLISNIFFEVPFLKSLLELGHFIASSRTGMPADKPFVEAVTNGDRPVLLLPGGAYECEKNYSSRYVVDWKDNPGFARVLLDDANGKPGKGTRVIPFFTTNCEESLLTHPAWYDFSGKIVRQGLLDLRKGKIWVLPKLMIIGFFSLGFHLLPRPVNMELHFGEPLTARPNETPVEFAKRVQTNLQWLIDSTQPKASKSLRDVSLLRKIARRPILAIFTAAQNFFIIAFSLSLIVFVLPWILIYKIAVSFMKKRERVTIENNPKQ